MEKIIRLILFDVNKLKDDFLNISYLSKEDIKNALRYKNMIDKKQHIISSYLKRKYVKNYYLDENKKPISNDIFFNISHSKNLVGIALGDIEIGLDIEYKNKDRNDKLINYICSDNEIEFIKEESDFYKIWTSKESLLKCVGIGIVNSLAYVNALPLNGKKIYNDETYYSHYIDYLDYSISITIKGDKNFKFELIEEDAYGD